MKLFISSCILLICFCWQANAQQKKDTIVATMDSLSLVNKDEPKQKHFQYFRFGVDISKNIRSLFTNQYNTSEFLIESIWKPKMHYVAEFGLASSKNGVSDSFVVFDASSYFLRLGFDKYFFGQLFKEDLDNAFIGVRYGAALNYREQATAQLWDPFYGNTQITRPAQTTYLHWLSLTAGFRLELFKNIFIGWNLRGKTLLNPAKVSELTPTYLAGYGAAKKQPNIDYNLYLLYGLGKR